MQFPELQNFLKEARKNNIVLAKLRGEVRAIKGINPKTPQEVTADGNSLFHLLPSQSITDKLVQIYLDNFETTHRILHVPTFRAEYRSFWNAPQAARPAFVAMLLGVLAVVYGVPDKEHFQYAGCSCKTREIAISWVRACDSWVGLQSHKHATIAIFQIQCLSLVAKRANAIKNKREWTSAGALQRTAMAAGLHREPRHQDDKTSVYEREMRRRLWATISELELQASIARGMLASFGNEQYDAKVPLNLDDEDFHELSKEIPMSKPRHHFTRTSFQHISRNSLPLRLELTSLVNTPGHHLQYEEVLQYDGRIMEFLDTIPNWDEDRAQGMDTAELSKFPQVFMNHQLRRFLLLLHRPFAQRGPRNARYSYSRMACMNAATSILDQYFQLPDTTKVVMRLVGDDLFNAALNVSFDLYNMDIKRGKRHVRGCVLFEY